MLRIVYTRPDGGVKICSPTSQIKAVMTNGGGWFDGNPLGISKAIEHEIEQQTANGRNKYVTIRFIKALAFGGLTDAEFYEVIRDRDCPSGTGHELWELSELPADRWFRDAWTRSHNGGPINVSLQKARPIQAQHIKTAFGKYKAERERAALLVTPHVAEPNWRALEDRLMRATDEIELRQVWPAELNPLQ